LHWLLELIVDVVLMQEDAVAETSQVSTHVNAAVWSRPCDQVHGRQQHGQVLVSYQQSVSLSLCLCLFLCFYITALLQASSKLTTKVMCFIRFIRS